MQHLLKYKLNACIDVHSHTETLETVNNGGIVQVFECGLHEVQNLKIRHQMRVWSPFRHGSGAETYQL